MNMYNEYDIVTPKKKISDKINTDTKGTVLEVFRDNPNSYIVEFMDEDGNTLGVLTLEEGELKG